MTATPVRTTAGPPDREADRAHPDRTLATAIALTVCAMPFLVPAGPGNTAVADAGMAVCICLGLLTAARTQAPYRLPYAIGVTGLLLGGALAATVVNAPLGSAIVLAQDVFLLLWAATLALGARDPALISAATVAWCRMAPVYAGIGIVAYLVGFTPLSGVNDAEGVRASYTLGDPNLAGNFLVVSLFVMVGCRRPRHALLRRTGYLLVLTALVFTGSNGAMLTLLVGLLACVTLGQYRQRGLLSGTLTLTGTALLAALMVVVVMPRVDLNQVRQEAAGSIPLLRDSLGRSAGSTSERTTILVEGYELYLDGNAAGVGPARTKATLQDAQAPYVKEAHNDYLATLLERGILGSVGLIVLIGAVGVRALRLAFGTLPPAYAALAPRPWALAVIAPVMLIAATFYEVLHFRHMWTWMGILAALVLVLDGLRPDRHAPRSRAEL